ncbi:MAG: hypothetical protein PVG14_17970 [Anaerolineales bacterium]
MDYKKFSNTITEHLLQQLLEDFPELLSFGMAKGSKEFRWVLIEREVGIPSDEEGTDRWYLDHLFIDQNAIPTLVEVKKASNDQIRRDVIGQMLDYASNATKYWQPGIIRQNFLNTCKKKDHDPIQLIHKLLNGEDDIDQKNVFFWKKVNSNLKSGRVRMVFFADIIPAELNTVVEFLQKQLSLAEVWAVGIKEFIVKNTKIIEKYYLDFSTTGMEAKGPDYDQLYVLAERQSGYFTASQAREVGFSWERLSDNVKTGKFSRVAHGIYRLVHFPGSSFEDLYVAMLRTGPRSAISHESALSVYDLSDNLPSGVHVIVPRTASRRRRGFKLHTNKLRDDEIIKYKGLQMTTVARTIADVASSGMAEELVRQAIQEALARGLVTPTELRTQARRSRGRAKKIIEDTVNKLSGS